jgi:hypothetical protein
MMSEPVNAESIPAALRSRSQWVMWRYESRGNGKPTKVPRTIDGALASTTGPGTWCSFAQAIAASPRFDGVGFVFTATDPWCGIDIDGCFAEDGTLLAWAVDLVSVAQTCEAYIERTPSGRGLHVIGVGVLPGRGRKVTGLGADGRGAVEVYDRDRYFTVTGEQTDLGDVGRDMGPLLAHIWRQYGLRDDADVVVDPGVEVTDARADELTRVLLAASRADFLGLWNGVYDAAQHGADRSRARMSLLTQIALKLSTEARIATPAEVRAVALRSPFIRQEMQRHKWPRLAGEECARAVAWAAEKLGRTATMDPVTVDEDGVITAPTHRQAMRLDIGELARGRAEPPRFVIPGWLPARAVTLFAAHGSGGKSQVALYLCVCLAMGLPFAGASVGRRRRVLFYSCEDDSRVLAYRLQQVCAALGVQMAELDGWLLLEDASEADNIMYTGHDDTARRLTETYRYVERCMRQGGVEVAVIDNASDVFGANEINRADVRGFISSLKRLATAHEDGAVLLLGHVNRETAKGGTGGQGYSGSTAWHNSVRSRWELAAEDKKRRRQEDGLDEDDDDTRDRPRVLTCAKSNYGPEGHTIRWCWNHLHGVLTPMEPPAQFGATHRRANEAEGVLRALREVTGAGVRVFANPKGPYSAATALEASPAFPDRLRSASGTETLRILLGLVQEGRVRRIEYREDGKSKARLEVCDE